MTDAILSIKGLTKSFGALTASDDVTIDLFAGEIHALIGPNGAGKSTLIKQIAGEYKQDFGQIYFEGVEVSKLNAVGRAQAGLARSFQVSSIMPNLSLLQNCMLAVQGKKKGRLRFFGAALKNKQLVDEARDYLSQVGLEGQAQIMASDLSHGGRRQLEIAMALAMEPKVFLLDEPMAGVGASGTQDLIGILAALKQKAPILLIEHDMEAVFKLADRISVLVYGRIIATGSVNEIRNNEQVQRAYLGDEDE